MILQYYVLLDLFYAGVHMLNVRCAPIKEIYDIVTLTCTNCLNWLKYLRNTSENRPDMMNCIVGLKIYHRNLNTITETVNSNRYFEINKISLIFWF